MATSKVFMVFQDQSVFFNERAEEESEDQESNSSLATNLLYEFEAFFLALSGLGLLLCNMGISPASPTSQRYCEAPVRHCERGKL